MTPTPEQEKEIRRLVDEGVPEDQARAMATSRQLDAPLDGDGNPLVPLPPS